MSLSWPRRAALSVSRALANKGLEGLSDLERGSVGESMLAGILQTRGNPPKRNTRDLLAMYRKQPWLRAVTSKIAFAVASNPWILKFVKDGGQAITAVPVKMSGLQSMRRNVLKQFEIEGAEVVTVVNHPALNVIHNPNPVMRGLAIRKVAQAHIDIVGETFYLKQRGPLGNVESLWTIPPHWVIQTPTINVPFYEVRWMAWQGLIPETEMIWACDNDPERPYWRGTGTAEALSDDLETDEYAAKHVKSTFYNNAVPELLITMENAPKGEVNRIENDWKKQNQGVFRQLRTYFLNRKVDVQQIGMNFRNLQLTQLREFERDTVVQVFGVPPEVLGILRNSNRATIEAANFLFSRWVLVPRLEMWREVYQSDLIDGFDERLLIDYVSPVEEDFDKRLRSFQAQPGAVSLREWRAFQGLNPEPEEDDVFLLPGSVKPTLAPDPDRLAKDRDRPPPPPPSPLLPAPDGGDGPPDPEPEPEPEEESDEKQQREWNAMRKLGLYDDDRPERLRA